MHMYKQHCLPLAFSYIPDTAGDLMASNSLSQEAVGSISNHFSNILLQHHLGLVG